MWIKLGSLLINTDNLTNIMLEKNKIVMKDTNNEKYVATYETEEEARKTYEQIVHGLKNGAIVLDLIGRNHVKDE